MEAAVETVAKKDITPRNVSNSSVKDWIPADDSPGPNPRNPATMVCRNCDETGHMSKECPKPRDCKSLLTSIKIGIT